MPALRRATAPVGARHLVARAPASHSPPLVQAKLRPPTLRPGTVDRAKLRKLIRGNPDRRLVSVFAAPGYGKTTLLAEVASSAMCAREPVAWLTIDDLDNDPATLLAYLAAAFDPLLPAVASHRGLLSGLVAPVVDRAVARFASRLQDVGAPALLVLDDVHRLIEPTSVDALAVLIDQLPPGMCVVLAGRSEPDLPFARFRSQKDLLEIKQDDLALDEAEVMAMTRAAGSQLAPQELGRLIERTLGWPAAIHLAILAAADEPGQRPLSDVSGTDPYIADYLRSEFARYVTEDDMAVLTRTAVIDPVPCELADMIAGSGAGERLWRLAKDHRLLTRLARSPRTVRCHPLLRDFLVAELERHQPATTAVVQRAAAVWHGRMGNHVQAVDHAIASGDSLLVAATVTAAAPDVPGETMERWLPSIDATAYRHYPPAAVVAAWQHLLRGRTDAAEQLADVAERATFEDRPADGSASFESQQARLRVVMCRRGPRAMLADAVFAASAETMSDRWHAAALWLVGESHLLLGDVGRADAVMRDATAIPGADRLSVVVAAAARSSLRIDDGDWATADALIGESRRAVVDWPDGPVVPFLRVLAIDARVAILLGDLPRARDDLGRAQSLVPLAGYASPWLSVDGLLHLAHAYLSISEIRNAQEVVRRAEQILRRRPNLGTLGARFIVLRSQVEEAGATLVGSSILTPAELRVVPYLPTHLSFQDIADRLTISRNTVKTHAMSIYSKLWASSRDEAVRRAVELGLLAPNPVLEAEQHGAHADLPRPTDVRAQRRRREPIAAGVRTRSPHLSGQARPHVVHP